jgi:sugar lactone lactonase YvrE
LSVVLSMLLAAVGLVSLAIGSNPQAAFAKSASKFERLPGVRFHGLPPNSHVPAWAVRRGVYLAPTWADIHRLDESGTSPADEEGPPEEGGPEELQPEEGNEGGGGKNTLGLRCESKYCPIPPARYRGGVVQHEPHLHLIFWGSNWNGSTGAALRTQLLSMFEGLSGSTYQEILTQYFDSTGRVSTNLSVDSMTDTRLTAPSNVEDAAIEAEVAYAIGQKAPGWSRELNQQFMVLTAPGTTYAPEFSGFCAYHDVDSQGGIYSIVPYAGDEPFKQSCQSYDPNGNVSNVTSIMASHEYAESATDPRWDTAPGWKDLEGYEITDICSSTGDVLANGSHVQGQYDDHLNACALADEKPPHVLAITDTATDVKKETATIRGTVNPEGLSTTYHFEYGTSKTYGTSVPATEGNLGSGIENVMVEAKLSGLQIGQTYHYRVAATNSTGTTYGEDRTFIPSQWMIDSRPAEPLSSVDYLNNVSCPSEVNCMAVGHYYDGVNKVLSYERTGGTWVGRGIPMPAGSERPQLNGVSCTTLSQCTSVGRVYVPAVSKEYVALIERWNGSGWAQQSLGLPGGSDGLVLHGVSCVSSSECMAVGSVHIAGAWSNYSALWREGSWTSLSTPTSAESTGGQLESVSCSSAGNCVAVGWFNTGVGSHATTAFWNGAAWTLKVPSRATEGALYGVSCLSAEFCIAAGAGSKIEEWNGTQWLAQATPSLPDANGATFSGVSCVTTTVCRAVGSAFSELNSRSMTLAEVWNGTEWRAETTPRESERARNELSAVSCSGMSVCTAVGLSLDTGESRGLIERRRVYGVTPSLALTFGTVGSGNGQLLTPLGSAVDAEGNVWVADSGNNRVEKFNSKGEYLSQFGSTGTGNGQFKKPIDIAITAGGDLLVTDGENNRVEKFNSKGEYLSQFGSGGTGNGQFTEPWGIDVAPDGNIWVADGRFYRVEEFSASGAFIRAVGSNSGSGHGQFSGPRGLAVDSDGHVWVADSRNNRVQELSSTGEYLGQFGTEGTGNGQFNDPFAIAIKPSGNLLVADRRNNRVEEFSPDGIYETQFATAESEGIATGPAGSAYVVNNPANRIEKWQQPVAPVVQTLQPSSMTEVTASLRGIVNPGNLSTTYRFDYGLTANYGNISPAPLGTLAASTTPSEVTSVVSGLKPGTTYHFRLVAYNENGISYGEDKTFTTLSTWSLQSSPSVSGAQWTAPRRVSCSTATECIAVGSYANSSGVKGPLAERWNGTAWALQSPASPSGAKWTALTGVACSSATACTAVGRYMNSSSVEVTLVERWNGTTWTVEMPPNPSGAKSSWLEDISCSSATACTAVGHYLNSSSVELALAERWNGTTWAIQSTPSPAGANSSQFADVSCFSATACRAVGSYVERGGFRVTLAESWNGTEWSVQATPNPIPTELSSLQGISCTSSKECVAVGGYRTGGEYRTLAEKQEGTEWTIQASAEPKRGSLMDVSCASKGWCEATGTNEGKEPLAEHWDGSEWTVESTSIPTGVSVSSLDGVSCQTTCVAVGHVETTNPAPLSETYPLRPPFAKTGSGTTSSATQATLGGVVNPDGSESKYFFEYGTTTSYGTKTEELSAGAGLSNLEESKKITGLASSTTYHFRIVATNSLGKTVGKDGVFKTPPPFDFTMGSTGSAGGQLKGPTGVAVDASENVWVADTGNNRIEEFSGKGKFIETFGKEVNKTKVEAKGTEAEKNLCTAASGNTCQAGVAGGANGQLGEPLGIATAPGSKIWVTEKLNKRLQEFNSAGEYLGQVTGSSGALFAEPFGIAIGAEGHIWVAQGGMGSIEEFTEAGAFMREIVGAERYGSGNGEFHHPTAVSTDSKGNVWVADTGNVRVQELNPNGEFLAKFSPGNTPYGIAVEPSGNLLIGFSSEVKEFSTGGEYLTRLWESEISFPQGIAVSPAESIYVPSTSSNKVDRWGF